MAQAQASPSPGTSRLWVSSLIPHRLSALSGQLRGYLELAKIRISGVSTLSAATGYIAMAHRVDLGLLWACLGTLFLACSASALNQIQEARFDALMERTRNRPIPSQRMAPGDALLFSAVVGLTGLGVLLVASGALPALLGLTALVWYNAVYTPLKRVSAFAVIPGSVIGALPPAIGWTAAGGAWSDPPLLAMSFFFFLWQVPHFWLLLFRLGQDYHRAGYPTLLRLFSRPQLARITTAWMALSAGVVVLLPLFGFAQTAAAPHFLAVCAILLIATAAWVWRGRGEIGRFGRAFAAVNLFALAVMAVLVVDALVSQ